MLDDGQVMSTLTDLLVTARSGSTVAEFLALFASQAVALVDADRISVYPLRRGSSLNDKGDAHGKVLKFRVWRGPAAWGELVVVGPGSDLNVQRGRLLAEVLGAALGAMTDDSVVPDVVERKTDTSRVSAQHPAPDDVVALVMECAEALDRMPGASTRVRLALVVSRVAAVVRSPYWSIELAHAGRLYDVSHDVAAAQSAAGHLDGATPHCGVAPGESRRLSRFPARRRASEGWAFYADRHTGDPAERRVLRALGCSALLGAGGYDQDGRSWVVTLFAGTDNDLEAVTGIVAALVQMALCFPRDAFVPRPEEPWVRGIFERPKGLPVSTPQRGLSRAVLADPLLAGASRTGNGLHHN